MKKILVIAAFGVAGLMSASTGAETTKSAEKMGTTQKFVKKTQFFLGTCVVTIYRQNADGSTTVVKTDVSLQPSEAACNTHAQIVLMDAQLGN